MRLGGWQRLGVVIWAIWALALTAYAIHELMTGTESRMLLIHMAETGEPGRWTQQGYTRTYLVPVQASLVVWRVLVALFVVPAVVLAAISVIAYAVRWVREGFKRSGA